MVRERMFALMTLSALVAGAAMSADLAARKALTLEVAKQIAAAAETEAKKNNWNVVIAILDEGGHLLYLQRMDETQIGSVDVAQQKAQSAVKFKRPTKRLSRTLWWAGVKRF